MEEELEKATAAQLEGFIAMKTKAITNSITQWAKRLTTKVKSVLEWIRTGGKENEEAIKQIDQRQRGHFLYEAHKKPRKKKKEKNRGDSTVHSTLRQLSMDNFVSLYNNLY